MHPQIQPDLPPETQILDPFQAPGFRLVGAPPELWSPIPAARVHAFTLDGQPVPPAGFPRALQVATLPVLMTDLDIRDAWISQGNRLLLSGRLGKTLLDAYAAAGPGNEARLVAHFTEAQNRPRHLSEQLDDLAPGTPFVLTCPGPHIHDSLAQLCLVDQTGLEGPIYLHFPEGNAPLAQARAWIETLFPELAPRIILDQAPTHHALAVLPYGFTTSLYQLPASAWDEIEEDFPPLGPWEGRRATRASHAILAAHAVDASLLALRDRGHALLASDSAHLPRRFWLAGGEPFPEAGELQEMLQLFGFVEVRLEALSPRDQIALMAGAELIVTTRTPPQVLFAAPETTVIEIGRPGTWPEAWIPLAVSGALHVTILQEEAPGLTRLGLARLMSLVVTLLGQVPEFSAPEDVTILGRQLMTLGQTARAAALFEAHAPLAENHPPLALAMADLAEARGEAANTLAALYMAYRSDPGDWAVLIRMLWCARAMGQAELIATLLATLNDGFPERYNAFARTQPWVAEYFTPTPEAP